VRRLLAASLFLLIAVDHHRTPQSFDEPDAAAAFFAMKRGITPQTDVHALYAAARERLARAPRSAQGSLAAGAWSFLGPGNIGGRTRAILVDPGQPSILYAGAVSGGVWKSTNGGASWMPVGDIMANLAVCTLAFDPGDSATIYAGTGEGYFREDVRGTALPIAGDGIFVTHDGGASWLHLPFTAGNADFQFVNDVVVNDHAIYAATRTGVWRSPDRGTTWTRVLPTTVKGGCLDLALAGGDNVLASCGIFEKATVYRTADGASWSPVLTDPLMGRTSLAVAPSSPDVVYALAACNAISTATCHDQGILGVYRSDRGGVAGSWRVQVRFDNPDPVAQTLLSNRLTSLAAVCNNNRPSWSNMGWHCNVIAVDPTNPERVWAAGVDLFRSDDGGRTWGEASYWEIEDSGAPQYAHADQHAIVFHPRYDGAGNQTVYFANDGGIYRSDNAAARVALGPRGPCLPSNTAVHFTSLNHNYGVTQFYSGAALPDGSRWFGGAQDNGTVIGDNAGGVNGWKLIFGGDGGTVAVDPVRPQTLYAEYQWGTMGRSDDGGQSFDYIHFGSGGNFLFISPYILDPNDHHRLFLGGDVLFRSADSGVTWKSASTAVPGGAMISAVAAVAGRPGFVLAGTTTGMILRNTNATETTGSTPWPSAQPRGGFVSSIVIDPTNPDTAYATYAGFGGGAHLWRSLDGGATWSPLDGSGAYSIPDIPVHSIALDGARLFLGTDLGILISTDAGATWHPENEFPAVITESIFIGQGPRGRALYAFTHGRGAWRADFDAPPRRHVTR
jgi:hypothetical protein